MSKFHFWSMIVIFMYELVAWYFLAPLAYSGSLASTIGLGFSCAIGGFSLGTIYRNLDN